jgi:HD superfamily phosphohydrolase YqeK
MAFAHSENSRGVRHDLETHLRAVAELAAQYAGKFGAADLGYWAGLWHDLRKSRRAFQAWFAIPRFESRKNTRPERCAGQTAHAEGVRGFVPS